MSTEFDGSSDVGLTAAQRRSVLRVAALTVALAAATPMYYGLQWFAPTLAAAVPAVFVHAALGASLFVAFPGMLAYGHVLRRGPGGPSEERTYGVNDRWERQNL